jgi:hypothetical protein
MVSLLRCQALTAACGTNIVRCVRVLAHPAEHVFCELPEFPVADPTVQGADGRCCSPLHAAALSITHPIPTSLAVESTRNARGSLVDPDAQAEGTGVDQNVVVPLNTQVLLGGSSAVKPERHVP